MKLLKTLLNEAAEWQPVPGWETYEVSTDGLVRKAASGKIVRPWVHYGKGGKYLRVTLREAGRRKNFRVHRLVAMAFIPNPDQLPEVDHINGDTFDNHVENLEWVSGKENIHRRTLTWREQQKEQGY